MRVVKAKLISNLKWIAPSVKQLLLEMVLFYRKICGFIRHIEIRYGDSHGNVFI
jgi:hypothetical protein